jgi:hypothetical protein
VISSFSLAPGSYLLEAVVSAGDRELHRASPKSTFLPAS